MDRALEKATLLFELGLLISPLRELAVENENLTVGARHRLEAKYSGTWHTYFERVRSFCNGEAGHNYNFALRKVGDLLSRLQETAGTAVSTSPGSLAAVLTNELPEAMMILSAIPVPEMTVVAEAETPYAAYCLVKDRISVAQREVVIADPYVNEDIFYRFLRGLAPTVSVTVFSESLGDRHKVGFMSVSRLFAQEMGSRYRLVEVNSGFHDRHVRSDDVFFHVGGSLKDIGRLDSCTVTRIDEQVGVGILSNLEHEGREVFGPSNPTHPAA